MGCGSSAAKTPAKPPPAPKQPSFAEKKKNLNPADYIISKRTGESIVKEEGSINGEQFNIDECKDCDIFLLDNVATSFVDYCENCRIYVGPIETSIFIRNCTNCSFVLSCQQFRSRDCSDCKFALMCTTEPIIETSTNMQFACFEFSYFSLRQQLARSKLKLWNNKWWQIHDFNKNVDKPNWSIFPQDEVKKLLRPESCPGVAALSPEEQQIEPVVPLTLGSRPWPYQDNCFLLFLPGGDTFVEVFLTRVAKEQGWSLCRTRGIILDQDRLKNLLAWTKEPKLAKELAGKEISGVQVCGQGIFQQVQAALGSPELADGAKSIRLVPEGESATLGKAFFEVWKDEI